MTKNNYEGVTNQAFSIHKPIKIQNNTERKVYKQRGGKRFNRKAKHSIHSVNHQTNDKKENIKDNDLNYTLEDINLYDGVFNISSIETDNDIALLDGGATCHISNKKNWFINLNSIKPTPILSANGTMYAIGKGDLKITFESDGRIINWLLKDTLFIPDCKATLISIAAMWKTRWCVLHEPHLSKATIFNNEGINIATIPQIGNKLLIKVISEHAYNINYSRPSLLTWHQRLSHLNIRDLKHLLKTNYKLNYNKDNFDCHFCEIAKSNKQQYINQPEITKAPLELIHSDIIGPLSLDRNNNRYVLTFIDDYTRYAIVCLLKDRVEAITKFEHYKKLMETRCERKLKAIRVDRAPEFTSKDFKTFLVSNGIELQLTAGYSPQSNGLAERYNRTLIDGTRVNLFTSRLPEIYWGYALLHQNYTRNVSPHHSKKMKTPYELLYSRIPNINNIKIFGCRAFAHRPNETRNGKLDSTAFAGVYLGKSIESDGVYILLNNDKIMIAKHVRYREDEFPGKPFQSNDANNFTSRVGVSVINSNGNTLRRKNFQQQQQEIRNREAASRLMAEEQEARRIIDENNAYVENQNKATTNEEYNQMNGNISETQNEVNPETNNESMMPGELPPSPQGPARNTRSKGIVNNTSSISYIDSAFLIDIGNAPIPRTYKEAISSPEREEWLKACQDEMESHRENNTWQVMENLPTDREVIGSRWVFTRKTNADGHVIQHKARLVAQGYSQRPGFDYDITYSPVVSLSTVRILVAIATKEKLHLHQMDVKAAYLHGRIDRDIFMKQPPGFISKSCPNGVCKLNKSLYGLKQSGRLWYERLKQELEKLNFKACIFEGCLFYHQTFNIVIAVYVDDIILIGKDIANINYIKGKLSKSFSMKDMGQAKYILGIQINYDKENGKSQLCLGSYLEKAINNLNIQNFTPYSLPIDKSTKLSITQCPSNENDKILMQKVPYAQSIGALNWLALTVRPDISYAVNYCAQFTANPGQEHWKQVKRIFGYLKKTKGFKLTYDANATEIEGYTDADLGGDPDNRRSTSGYIFLIAGGAVSWSSKKQSISAISTQESEYTAIEFGSREAIWITRILEFIGRPLSSPIIINSDNEAAIRAVKEPFMKGSLKQVETRIYAANDRYLKKYFNIKWIPSSRQIADLFTKGLTGDTLYILRNRAGLKHDEDNRWEEC